MKQNESGNVFFYIFIGIILLAALSFAVSQGGRSSITQLTQDTRSLVASEIIGYADTVSKAVTQLRLRGTSLDDLSFDTSFASVENAPNEIFNPAGGAVVYNSAPGNATAGNWLFLSDNAVENVGTAAGELLMAVEGVNQGVCIQINNLLDVGAAGAAPPSDSDVDTTTLHTPGSSLGNGTVIGDEDAALDGQREACLNEGGTQFIYYKVLQPR